MNKKHVAHGIIRLLVSNPTITKIDRHQYSDEYNDTVEYNLELDDGKNNSNLQLKCIR